MRGGCFCAPYAHGLGVRLLIAARELLRSLLLRGGRIYFAERSWGTSWVPPCEFPPPEGIALPSGFPGDFVQRPPVKTPADILALRSSGLDVLITRELSHTCLKSNNYNFSSHDRQRYGFDASDYASKLHVYHSNDVLNNLFCQRQK